MFSLRYQSITSRWLESLAGILARVTCGVTLLSLQPLLAENLPIEERQLVVEGNQITTAQLFGGEQFWIYFPKYDFSHVVDGSGYGKTPISQTIENWVDEGTAAGNVGDVYENRDNGHSRLNLNQFGELVAVTYAEDLKKQGIDYGAKFQFAHHRPAIINASVAFKGRPFSQSMPRAMLHNPTIGLKLYPLYRLSDFCFYPEHRDHDKVRGDMFAVNTPYVIISQGSSGSDKAFMEAVAQTLASFHPEVKEKLHQRGLLAPAVQMIMRWCNVGIGDAQRYLSGQAHPSVFKAANLRPEAMIEMAHDIAPDTLPPLAMIEMVEEEEAVLGRDFFDPGATEKLLDTPCAIGRVARNLGYERRFVVSAEKSMDANDLPLTYHWQVLRGDESLISIQPLDPSGKRAEITVAYQRETSVPGNAELRSQRVDIGVFVNNGTYFSPPSFISIWFPPTDRRFYNDQKRLTHVEYQSPLTKNEETDVALTFAKPWSDYYRYDDQGSLLGWERRYEDGSRVEQYGPEGMLQDLQTGDWRIPRYTTTVSRKQVQNVTVE
ncbi:MAG: hypothetical protein AAFX93_07935 [Verrucomicrobiota bacterium]